MGGLWGRCASFLKCLTCSPERSLFSVKGFCINKYCLNVKLNMTEKPDCQSKTLVMSILIRTRAVCPPLAHMHIWLESKQKWPSKLLNLILKHVSSYVLLLKAFGCILFVIHAEHNWAKSLLAFIY